ncbi:hypothetical protein [Amycolatopsis sp. CA-128772]|uniref:hypothetical protein n=1 Tax=Amycolatopsis sp. CA-128772 TaxID=2073159 RepID=UPI000CCFE8CA|nr:hypothetical protein [Amycolatopsis sp. CA-128772]
MKHFLLVGAAALALTACTAQPPPAAPPSSSMPGMSSMAPPSSSVAENATSNAHPPNRTVLFVHVHHPGTFGYLCTIHPFMTATVTVTP